MPVAAILADKIIAMHGGLSPELTILEQIARIERPTEVPEDGLDGHRVPVLHPDLAELPQQPVGARARVGPRLVGRRGGRLLLLLHVGGGRGHVVPARWHAAGLG